MTQKKYAAPEEKPLDAIEKALLKQEEVHTEEMIDRESGKVLETAKRRKVTKEIVPDVRALLFWLKNRRPERWRERIEPQESAPEYEFDPDEERL